MDISCGTQVVEVKRVSNRLMSIKLVIGGSMVNVISVYAPQVGLDEEEKKGFWEVLDEVWRGVPSTEKLFVGEDFNRHIGSLLRGYEDVHGSFDLGERNEEVKRKAESKKVAYSKLVESNDDKDRQTNKKDYKVAKREAELVVTTAKKITFESLNAALEEKDRDKKLYRLSKARKWKTWDLDQVKCIQGEDGAVLVKDALIRKRW
ncbi:uncharacterized protein LOC124887841 [Capsicum annuum]|uniref:uncharacterized protein LOC124887841 n=1 Tax=Capsicum annuum TaxID=4072 RepID=UPI001FB0F6FE|nr:uncharacterized protein LOC124887841 [Capsicum annuum]